MIPLAQPGGLPRLHPRLPSAEVEKEGEDAAFLGRIEAKLVSAVLDHERLPACAEGIQFGPALDPQPRRRPQFRAVGHDGRLALALEGLTLVADDKSGRRGEGVVVSPATVGQGAVKAPEPRGGPIFSQHTGREACQGGQQGTQDKQVTFHRIASFLLGVGHFDKRPILAL